jgi:hypothetical protein
MWIARQRWAVATSLRRKSRRSGENRAPGGGKAWPSFDVRTAAKACRPFRGFTECSVNMAFPPHAISRRAGKNSINSSLMESPIAANAARIQVKCDGFEGQLLLPHFTGNPPRCSGVSF